MKTIGLIGGLSWESSAIYYKIINEQVRHRLGGVHSCECLLYSVDFGAIAPLQAAGDWERLGEMMQAAALRLERGGADLILICANTMHKLAENIEAAVQIPLVHIADATAEAIQQHGFTTLGLLGTRYTMEQDFLKERLRQKGNIHCIIPTEAQRETVHRIIYEELTKGIFQASSRQAYLEIVDDLTRRGAQGIILGCTEIGMLIDQSHTSAQLFDTTIIHAHKAVELALQARPTLHLRRTNSEDPDFQTLVRALDADLRIRDGEDHAFYAQFNKIDLIKHVIVAYNEQGTPVGCGAIKAFDTDIMEVKRMYVLPEKRGLGIASGILKGLETWAQELGMTKCVLETGQAQPEAIALYQKCGYRVIPNYGQYVGVENSVCFEKVLHL